MHELNKLIILCVTIINMVSAYDSIKQKSSNFNMISRKQTAHISPEILNEFKDFKNLIPTATVDEIVAKHLLIDGNFRTAFKYLRSQEFSQLEKQLLNVPEIIDVLEFLHLTTTNATTRHMGATKMIATARIIPSLEKYYVHTVAGSYNSNAKLTTTTDTSNSKPQTMDMETLKEALNNLKVPKRSQQLFDIKEDNNKYVEIKYDDDDDETVNANSVASNGQQSLVHIVLLEDLEAEAMGQHKPHHHFQHYRHKYNRLCHNCYQHHGSLGTFTTFVEEILEHLPNAAYQNMIKDKCRKNSKFAEFYQALRSAELKPLIEQVKSTNNIKNIIQNLNSHDVDVNALEPIAFKVISWGPNI